MAAPVFSSEGEVCLEIVMSAFPEGMSKKNGRALRDKAYGSC